ncbi:MAG: hypothetical protein JRI59_10780, partial [Deltaproteobacteria bacterium]|nr:hypothetical protein [Deltaproteobacteria bacterium]
SAAGWLVLTVTPEVVETLGHVNYVHFSLPDPFLPEHPRASWIAALEPGVPAAPEQELHLAFDPARLHFFDRQTGEALG